MVHQWGCRKRRKIEAVPYTIVQDPILVLEGSHQGILGQCIRSALVLLIGTRDLLLNGLDDGRQEADEIEPAALVFGEA